jgi:TonB family protein
MKSILFVLALLLTAAPAAAQKGRSLEADTTGVYELRAVTAAPRPLNVADLQAALLNTYPQELRDAGVNGEVQVRFRVDARGMPHNLVVTQSSNPQFDAPTLEAVRKLRFTPAEVNGKPVQVWVVLPIQWVVGA